MAPNVRNRSSSRESAFLGEQVDVERGLTFPIAHNNPKYDLIDHEPRIVSDLRAIAEMHCAVESFGEDATGVAWIRNLL